MIVTLLLFVITLSLLVFVHELGHFLSAKWFGVRVDEFGFGFPPRIFGVKRGDTVYSVNWIPMGGFVKIKGESGEARHDRDSFGHQSFGRRSTIILAGVVMNIVFAWLLFTVGYMVGLPQMTDGLPSYAKVRNSNIQIVSVLPNSPAQQAGIQSGDVVTSIDGVTATSLVVFREYTAGKRDVPVTLTLRRKNQDVRVVTTPRFLDETKRPSLGIALVETGTVSYAWYQAPYAGFVATVSAAGQIFSTLGIVLRDLVVTQRTDVALSGPVGIAVMTGEVAKMGLGYMVQFAALLSINLGIINVLPIPALDGGRMLFLVIERIRGRAVRRSWETMSHMIGFGVLLLLVLVVTYLDLTRFGERIIRTLTQLFTA